MSQDPIQAFLSTPSSLTPADVVNFYADKYGVDKDFAQRIAKQESGFNQKAVSSKGARGVMQLMPETAKTLGVDPYDMHQNIEGGVRYLKQNLDQFNGDQRLAAAAYNAGPHRVQQYGGVPPFVETQDYVDKTAQNPTTEFLQSKDPVADFLAQAPVPAGQNVPRGTDSFDVRKFLPRDKKLPDNFNVRKLLPRDKPVVDQNAALIDSLNNPARGQQTSSIAGNRTPTIANVNQNIADAREGQIQQAIQDASIKRQRDAAFQNALNVPPDQKRAALIELGKFGQVNADEAAKLGVSQSYINDAMLGGVAVGATGLGATLGSALKYIPLQGTGSINTLGTDQSIGGRLQTQMNAAAQQAEAESNVIGKGGFVGEGLKQGGQLLPDLLAIGIIGPEGVAMNTAAFSGLGAAKTLAKGGTAGQAFDSAFGNALGALSGHVLGGLPLAGRVLGNAGLGVVVTAAQGGDRRAMVTSGLLFGFQGALAGGGAGKEAQVLESIHSPDVQAAAEAYLNNPTPEGSAALARAIAGHGFTPDEGNAVVDKINEAAQGTVAKPDSFDVGANLPRDKESASVAKPEAAPVVQESTTTPDSLKSQQGVDQNAINQVQQQASIQPEHQEGSSSQQADQAGGGNRILDQAGSGEEGQVTRIKPPWEMNLDELNQELVDSRGEDSRNFTRLFGEEGAKRYESLRRASNSTTDSQRADEAYDQMLAMEKNLSPEQKNILYGKNSTTHDPEQVREYINAAESITGTTPDELAEDIHRALTQIGNEPDPEKMTEPQRLALVKLNRAAEIAKENGFDINEIGKKAATLSAKRFGNAQDALYMLRRWLNGNGEEAQSNINQQKGLPAAGEGQVTAHEQTPINQEVAANPDTEAVHVSTGLIDADTPLAQSVNRVIDGDTSSEAIDGIRQAANEHGLAAATADSIVDGAIKVATGQPTNAGPEPRASESQGTTNETGLGGPEAGAVNPAVLNAVGVGVPKLIEKDIIPIGAKGIAAFRSAFSDIRKVFAPASRGHQAGQAAGIIRANVGEMVRKGDVAAKAMENAGKLLMKLPEADRWAFIDRVETGGSQPTPELQAIHDAMRQLLDDRRAEVQALGTGKLQTYIQDYFPHIWEDPAKAASIFGEFYGKRPLEGSKNFLKQRSIPTIADGLAAGLKPVTDNPVELLLLKLREVDRYVMAQHVLGEFKSEKIAKYVPAGKQAPEGYTKIDDKVATVYGGPDSKPQGGTLIRGQYYAPEAAARVFNNYLSPGLRGKPWFDAYLAGANILNQAQLGLSAYHLGFTSVDAMVSKTALGINQLAAGKPISALGSFARTPIAPIENIIRGSRLMKEWNAPGTQGAELTALANAMQEAGGRAQMDKFYSAGITRNMKQAFREGNVIGGILRAPFAVVETAAKPIMEYIVPRQKMGIFADLARLEMEKLPAGSTREQYRAAMARAWDSVDNRMGQMVYDNLFWDKVGKDLLMGSVRSVGWNLGTFRELGGGVLDIGQTARDATIGKPTVYHIDPTTGKESVVARQRQFTVTPRTAYAIALPLVVGTLGAITQYLYTGKGPEELKDYFFPKTGKKDEQGNDERVSLPSYMKDVYAYSRHPVKTLQHKTNPLISLTAEMLENEDFYGTEIRNANDPKMQQMMDMIRHVGTAAVPFGIRGMQKEYERSGKLNFLPQIGITPAPAEINRSPADNMMADFNRSKISQGVRTKEEAQKSLTRRDAVKGLREGETSKLGEAIQSGDMGKTELKSLVKKGTETPRQVSFGQLTDDEALQVWNTMRPVERQEVALQLMEKANRYIGGDAKSVGARKQLAPNQIQKYAPLYLEAMKQIPQKPALTLRTP